MSDLYGQIVIKLWHLSSQCEWDNEFGTEAGWRLLKLLTLLKAIFIYIDLMVININGMCRINCVSQTVRLFVDNAVPKELIFFIAHLN